MITQQELRLLQRDTLELMHIIDRCDEFGLSCMLWNLGTSCEGYPQYKPTGRKFSALVRREVFRMSGKEVGFRQPIQMTCGEKRCLNPDHMRATSIGVIARDTAKKGGWKGLVRSAKIAHTKRGKMKLTLEQAREIRGSTETGRALSARYGVTHSMVYRIKAGRAWREYTNNPFLSLIAANDNKSLRSA